MSPTDDRDIRAALSRDPYPSGATRLSTDAEGAVVPSLDGQPDPLRDAARKSGGPMTAPKPCPFCGHPEPTMMHDGPSLPRGYTASWLWCEACNATGPEENTGDQADAITAWNRALRPEGPPAPGWPIEHAQEARRRALRVRDRRRRK